MSFPDSSVPNQSAPATALTPLSAFATQSFPSTEVLIRTLLQLINEQLGVRTSFLTKVDQAENNNAILATNNLEGGCDLAAGITLPLSETFCTLITNAHPPAPLIIENVRYDTLFSDHPAARASPQIGCFVGVPIVLRDGQLFGTLCAIDPQPQVITNLQTDLLIVLARFVATQLDQDRDREQREQIAAERDQLYHMAQEALRERDALVAIASHELRNPLTALIGQAQLLQRHLGHSETVAERDLHRVSVIIGQAQRLNTMLSELLDVSQLEAGQLALDETPVDMFPMVQRVVDEMYALYQEHDIALIAPNEPVLVQGDVQRLEQVVRNLFSNAIKYTAPGGHIELGVAREEATAVFYVRDTGIGIAADALPDVFRRFYRAKSSQQAATGFGIGLYVVKEIVTRHGGTVQITGTEGIGTTFTVRMPLL